MNFSGTTALLALSHEFSHVLPGTAFIASECYLNVLYQEFMLPEIVNCLEHPSQSLSFWLKVASFACWSYWVMSMVLTSE